MEHYNPNRPETEDDRTIADHANWMKNEALKKRQDFKKIETLMDLTFADRRKFILDFPTLNTVQEKYPCLFSREEIKNEFNRLSTVDISSKFLAQMKKYSLKILKLANNDCPMKKITNEMLENVKSDEERGYVTGVGSLLVLPHLLKEKVTTLFVEEKSTVNHPVVVYDSMKSVFSPADSDDMMFEIKAEGITVCEPVEFLEAVECLLCTYYGMNMAYPSGAKATLQFLQKVYLEITDNEKTDKKVLSLIQRL